MSALHCYAPRGGYNNTSAALALRALDHPEHMSMVDLLVRELIQNSLDAKDDQQEGVAVDFDIYKPNDAEISAWKTCLGESPVGQWVAHFLEEEWCLLRVTDRGTTGLNGPVDPYSSSQNEPPRFQRVAYAFGKPDQSNAMGIGSWGLGGKTVVFRMAASLGLVAYYSRPQNGEASRFIAVHCYDHAGKESALKDAFDGFAWWGAKTSDDRVNGMTGAAADRCAGAIGFDIDSDFRGTQILMPLPLSALHSVLPVEVGNIDELPRAMTRFTDEIKLSVIRWWWPRLSGCVDDAGQRKRSDLTVRVSLDIAPLACRDKSDSINPKLHRFYENFAELYRRTFKEDDSRLALRGRNYGQYLLGYVVREILDDSGLDGDFLRDEWARMGLMDGSWAIAHIRNSGLVVSYSPSPKMRASRQASGVSLMCSDGGLPLAVLRVNGHCAVKKNATAAEGELKLESVFRAAENSAHSEWSYNLVSDRRDELGEWACQYISQTYNGIKELFSENDSSGTEDSGGAEDLAALAQISHELGKLLPLDVQGSPASGSGKPNPPSGSGNGNGNGGRAKKSGGVKLVSFEAAETPDEFRLTIEVTGSEDRDVEICVLDEAGKEIELAVWEAYCRGESYPLAVLGTENNRVTLAPGKHRKTIRIAGPWLVNAKEIR